MTFTEKKPQRQSFFKGPVYHMRAAQENVKCEADFHMTHACWCQFLSSGSIIWLDTGAQMEDV